MDYWLEGGAGIEGISMETTRFSAVLLEEARENVQQFVRQKPTTSAAHRGFGFGFPLRCLLFQEPEGSVSEAAFFCSLFLARQEK